MSAESILEEAFTRVRGWSAREDAVGQAAAFRTATVNFEWSGGGKPFTPIVDPVTLISRPATDPILIEVPFASTIVWAHMYAGDAAGQPVVITATIDLRLTQFATFGTRVLLSGAGTLPTLLTASTANIDLTGWQTNLISGDVIIARLLELTGAATWVALAVMLRSVDAAQGVTDVIDTSGEVVTDASGIPMVFRS